MNNPERLPSETHKPITGYLWGGLAVLTCPCHLPILAVVLAGTTAGAFLGEHWVIAALGLTGLFLLSLSRALRACWRLKPGVMLPGRKLKVRWNHMNMRHRVSLLAPRKISRLTTISVVAWISSNSDDRIANPPSRTG